eukprot:s4167_g9.t1
MTIQFFFTIVGKDEHDDVDFHVQVWGLPWEPNEFMRMAVQAGHPASLESFLPVRLADCINLAMKMSSVDRMKHRAQALKFWLKRSLELKESERQLHDALHPDVAAVLKGKRILPWEEMLQAIKYEDRGVVEEFKSGAGLIGPAEVTGLWPKKFIPATLTASDLSAMAKEREPHTALFTRLCSEVPK